MEPEGLRYTEEHEWIGEEDGLYLVGITEFAQEHMGDITYVELPEVGMEVARGQDVSVVESVKAAGDVYAPVTGVVVEVNTILEERPELVNKDAYGDGWFFKLKSVNRDELKALMDFTAYEAFLMEQTE